MIETKPPTVALPRRFRGMLVIALVIAPMVLTSLVAATTAARAGQTRLLQATYFISIAGLRVGKIDVEGRFSDDAYATSISGATYGISRIVSNARAALIGSGRIGTERVIPSSYYMETAQNGGATQVSMLMRGGTITELRAMPDLLASPDRIPVRTSHKRNILDPVGAFVISVGKTDTLDGKRACGRTLRVFDGWLRFDVKLNYERKIEVSGVGQSYTGPVVVCSARYIPVAGHRPGRESALYMSSNRRLEVWLAPIAGTKVMVPFHFLIGTKSGDLVISARKFIVSGTERQASSR
jgi:hypothetical protein